LNAWLETTQNYPRQRILWVTHGGVIRVILCKIRQQPIAQLLQIEVRHAALFQVRISDCADAAGDAELVEE
ncbi:MAG: histidine phosphatase family protein, partial [Ketobacter sp.]|nr:histidine phosphatase family protein [Ketobacter sp.]